jgi:hypothetical protein
MQHAKAFVDISRVLARIAAGDRDAYAEVVEKYQRPLFDSSGLS